MPEDDKQQPGEVIEGEFVEVPFPTFYTNNIQINHTLFDFGFLVMERLEARAITIRARIVMSPAHAKALHNALGTQLDKFEERFGEIRLTKRDSATSSPTAHEPQRSQSPPDAEA